MLGVGRHYIKTNKTCLSSLQRAYQYGLGLQQRGVSVGSQEAGSELQVWQLQMDPAASRSRIQIPLLPVVASAAGLRRQRCRIWVCPRRVGLLSEALLESELKKFMVNMNAVNQFWRESDPFGRHCQ